MSQQFQLVVERLEEDACALAIAGDLDVATAPHFRRAVAGLLGSGTRRLMVDMRHTDFLDSSGLGALVWAQFRLRAAGGDLAVAGAHDGVRQTIAVSHLDDLIELVDTREAALTRLGVTAVRARARG
jgi:anti-sigma B factor antagonist